MPKRVLLTGLFHETHTFLDGRTRIDDFSLRFGDELFDARDDGSPLSGVLEVAAAQKWDVVPAVDLRATPSATVDDAVFESFWSELAQVLDDGARSSAIDGIYLVLHGAMACDTIRDVEGELIRRIRSTSPGLVLPICGVLDLHGNISRDTIERSQGFVAYRSNPHVDARQAAIDAALLLDRILSTGIKPIAVFEQCPLLWPPTGTGTDNQPMRSLEAMARAIERDHPEIAAVNVMGGFSFADTCDTGVSFSAVTFGDPHEARRQLAELCNFAIEHREQGNVVDPPLKSVMPKILQQIERGKTPVAIVEPSDNIGGGAPGDGTTILRELVECGVDGSAVIINDPEAVLALRNLRAGQSKCVSIGGKGSRLTDPPIELDVELVSRSDGRFELEDRHSHLASMSGVRIDMGPCAVVKYKGIAILLTSKKTPPFDLGQLRSQGIEPEKLTAIGIKAAVAHRRAYDKICHSSFTVATPGPCSSDVNNLPFRHIRRPVYPLDELDSRH